MSVPAPKKVNYLNNRDILKEIHLSKNSYCSYLDPQADHQYDIILPAVGRINQRTIVEARRNRAERLRRDTGEEVNEKKIPHTDLVFRITCWDHIPKAPKRPTKAQAKKQRLEELLDMDTAEADDADDLVDVPVLDMNHVRLNFPPFWHYRLDADKNPIVVGKSHWQGDLVTGQYS